MTLTLIAEESGTQRNGEWGVYKLFEEGLFHQRLSVLYY